MSLTPPVQTPVRRSPIAMHPESVSSETPFDIISRLSLGLQTTDRDSSDTIIFPPPEPDSDREL